MRPATGKSRVTAVESVRKIIEERTECRLQFRSIAAVSIPPMEFEHRAQRMPRDAYQIEQIPR
ncbi:MAG: hypothetical protein AAFR88_12430, partial [Pseudomonadota bacterium]